MPDVKILMAIPVKRDLNDDLKARMFALLDEVKKAHPEIDIFIWENDPIVEPQRGTPGYVMDRSKNLVNARNGLLEQIDIDKYTHVLWIDADIIKYPLDLAYQLLSVSKTDIVAPMILIDGSVQYYDTYTHIEAWGRQAEPAPPYFYSQEDKIEMDCVGGCYIIPAEIYKTTRYKPYGGPGMEHYYLMNEAKRWGYKIFVSRNVVVYHARLPDWGEEFH